MENVVRLSGKIVLLLNVGQTTLDLSSHINSFYQPKHRSAHLVSRTQIVRAAPCLWVREERESIDLSLWHWNTTDPSASRAGSCF